MEIQKIYSEVNTEEKLYSVLMTEDELALFSEIQKKEMSDEDYNKVSNKIDKKILKGLGGSVSGLGFAALAQKKYLDSISKSNLGGVVNSKKLRKTAQKLAERDGKLALGAGLASLGSLAYAGKQVHDIDKLNKTPGYKEKLKKKLNK